MQETRRISTGEDLAAGCKVNRANAQSRISGILLSPDNGKLCFVQQTYDLQHKTTCPRTFDAGEETRSEVGVSVKIIQQEKARGLSLKSWRAFQKSSPSKFQKAAGFSKTISNQFISPLQSKSV